MRCFAGLTPVACHSWVHPLFRCGERAFRVLQGAGAEGPRAAAPAEISCFQINSGMADASLACAAPWHRSLAFRSSPPTLPRFHLPHQRVLSRCLLAASDGWRWPLAERLCAPNPMLAGIRMRDARRPHRQPSSCLTRTDPWRPFAAADGPSAAADGHFCVTCSSLVARQVRADRVRARRAQ